MSVNGTYQFGVTNSWRVSRVLQTYDNVAHIPPPPDEEYFLMTIFGFLVVGLFPREDFAGIQAVTSFGFVVKSLLSSSLRRLWRIMPVQPHAYGRPRVRLASR